MQRKQAHVVLGILIAVIVCLIGGFGANGISAHASTVAVSGLGENDATITDSSGNSVPNGSELSKWDNYEVHYQWGIPDGEPIQAGDTVTVNLPQNAAGRKNLSFPLYDDNGVEIGTFSIAEDATTGTITFNDALAGTATNREGTLQFYVKGTQENENIGLDWGINKIGWVSGHNPDGTPSQLTWNIAFNPNSTHLGETVITDNLGPGQTYIPGSVQAPTGKFDSNGNFVADGGALTPTVETSGNTVIFTFDDVTTAVNMTYHTKPDVSGTSGIWKNSASLNGQNVGSSIAWGGAGSGNGSGNAEEDLGSVQLTKTDAATGKVLAGAVYELQDANGEVLKSGLTTDAQGVLTYADLAAGHYQFVETQAPEGYALDTTPVPFDITAGSSATVSVSAKDTALTGGGTEPENPENPENPGTTTPPTTPTEPESPENPGTTTPPTTPTEPENPENPGTTTPPTTPTEPENPENTGTTTPPTTPTEPENPENPGTTTPTTPTEPENPGTTTPVEPETPGASENPSVTSPNNPEMNPTTGNGGSGDTGSGQSAGTGTPSASTNGSGTSSASGHSASGKLPQTGEHKTSSHVLTLAGFALLFASLGIWYHERHA